MQLDALLRSIQMYAPRLYNEQIVIWKDPPGGRAHAAYLDVFDRHRGTSWWRQGDFAVTARDALYGVSSYIAFHTDDDVWYRPAPIPNMVDGTWSMRLGFNTTRCHPLGGIEQRLPPAIPWAWDSEYDAEHDFAYPFSLDGHIYDAAIVRGLLSGLEFVNPNDLEHRACMKWKANPARYGTMMRAPRHSCVVSIPANRVTEGYYNPISDNPEWTAEALLEKWLDGWQLDLDAMDFSNVVGAHQEIPLKFSRR